MRDGRRRLIVAAVPPPRRSPVPVEAGPAFEEVAKLTARYNELLRGWCRTGGIPFLDYEAEMVDPGSGLPREDIQLEEGPMLTLAPYPFAAIVAAHLRHLGF